MIRPSQELATALSCEFRNPELLDEALTHRSCGSVNGERLEFLGDAILGFVIADRIFTTRSTASEGNMSRIRASLVRKETLAKIALQWKFGDYVRLGSGELKSGGFRRASILADAVEAVIGAMYMDQGLPATVALIEKLYGERLHLIAEIRVSKDPKTRLQEYLQSRSVSLPDYSIESEEGPPHQRKFVVSCHLKEIEIKTAGHGSSRRAAEQDAAKAALEVIESE